MSVVPYGGFTFFISTCKMKVVSTLDICSAPFLIMVVSYPVQKHTNIDITMYVLYTVCITLQCISYSSVVVITYL